MILIAIDPGAHTGIAVFDNTKLIESTRVKAPTFLAAMKIVTGYGDPGMMVIEGQYFTANYRAEQNHGRNASTWQAVMKLVELRTRWQHAAEFYEIPYEIIHPGKWIPSLTRNIYGKDSKDRIRKALLLRYPESNFKKDELDAVALGVWWIEERYVTTTKPTTK